MTDITAANTRTGFEIAVIGMAGKFPGAKDINQFWENLKNGVEAISFLSHEELIQEGHSRESLNNPDFVKVKGGVLENIEFFDAFLFDYTPKEAQIMDPQMRILHECAREALEDAGYNHESYNGLIGIYAGSSANTRWQARVLLSGHAAEIGQFEAQQLIERDFLCTRISYKLNLKGPAVVVQTACSTSLVAVHTACRSLLSGECHIALAGGSTIAPQYVNGYFYQEGIINSADGHCRAFDARANGTVSGEGAGIAVLKPLEEAEADRDHIYAVIKGTAINNDGARKMGYTAPAVNGQKKVIQAALHMAEVEPESITYIEAHGTGTTLGDPIEIEALTQAFNTNKTGFCAVGSIKTNLGHMDAAAGIAGLIKTVLALKHRQIPPTLHFNTPNPKIDFENSPFYVNTTLSTWKNNHYPLRAGISSFGIGGTNAHVVLEEWPGTCSPDPSTMANGKALIDVSSSSQSRQYQLILLSALTPSALDKLTKNLKEYLIKNPDINLTDAAYVLQIGRKPLPYRRALVCSTLHHAIEALSSKTLPEPKKCQTSYIKDKKVSIVFMFPGQGAQYVNMGLELYEKEPGFREEMDRCFKILESLMDYHIKDVLYPSTLVPSPSPPINQTEIAQPVLFACEYAMARLLMKWGIMPGTMIGHSIGEYTAACLSGVFSREDALKLVVLRGKLMQDTLPGSMLSVPLPADQIESLLKLDDNNELSLAAINSTSHCVISGSTRDIARLDNQLKEKGHHCRRLHTSHAFHSKAMDPILKKFEEKIREVTLNQPTFPYISNLTGTWIKKEEAMAPEYWVSHLRNTVRFAHGLAELLKEPGIIFLEVGPGRALSTFVKQHAHKRPDQLNLNLLAPPGEDTEEIKELLHKIGGLWIHGADIDWQGFYLNEKRYRIPLPTYPYERQRFWIDENPGTIMGTMLSNSRAPGKKIDPADWFYIPSWERSILPGLTNDNDLNNEGQPPATALILSGGSKFENRLVEQLKNLGWHIITVLSAYTFKTVNKGIHNYKINPCKSSDYNQLFTALRERGTFPTYIIHLWSITNKQDAQVDKKELSIDRFNKARDLGFYSLLNIVQSIGKQGITSEIQLVAITNNMVEVTGGELLYPEKATILGAVKIIPLEYSNITCRSIDIELPGPGGGQEFRLINQLVKEFSMPIDNSAGNAVAYRGDYRWVPCIKPVRLEKSDNHRLMQRFKNKGVYLISGGFGGMGFTLAQYLAKNFNASLILVGRSGCPGGNPWQKKIKEMEEQGAEIMTAAADVSNLQQMIKVVNQAKKRFGTINGVLHTAGVIDDAGVIQRRTRDMTEKVMAPKVKGTLVLDHILSDMKLDFFVLFSSLGNFLYQIKFGEVGYSAANEFLDAFAYYKKNNSSTLTVTINWDDWQKVGMAIKAIKQEYSFNAQQTDEGGNNNRSNMDRLESQLQDALSPSEGIDVFKRILEHSIPHVLVSTRDLKVIIERMKREGPEEAAEHKLLKIPITPKTSTQRPELSTGYTAPQNKIQQVLVNIFKEFFSYEQVGIDDDFFELGGDSLKAITILNKIHKVLNVKILLAEIFKKNTIRKLSIYISSLTENKYTAVKPVEQKEYYDLSPAQKRLYAFQQIHPQSTAYNMPILIESFKDPDRDKLEDVFKQLIQKHESLRTSFHTLAGQLVQKIHRHVEFSIEYDDKSNEKRADTTEITKDSVKPFDLSLAPLLRVRLIRTGPGKDQHSLMVDIHHNICDGMSLGILTRDFMKLYQGETPTTLTVQYKDYSQWQNSSTMKQLRKKQEAYWYKKFKDNIPALNIPTDYPRPTLQDFEGGSITFRIGKEEASEMHQMALNEDVTMYMLLLAVYTIMLSKLSRQEDIAVGTPMAGRQHPGLERLIGMFVNTLVMRNYPRRYITFREFLKDVKENTLEAFDNQEYYFEDLVSGVVINRDMSRNPLFDVIFNYQVMDIPGNKKSGITRDLYKKINTTSQFDFSFVANEIAGELLITIDYSTKLFKKDTIIRFGSYFQEIISNVLKNEEIKLDDIHISYHLGEARTNLPETRFVF